MIELRPFSKLGSADHGWLKAKHHFSFGGHYDPSNMGHGALRVWNDDEIARNTGFPAHPHANMEIITYVREGAITHQDNLGNEGRTEAGDVQVMSAGSGIRHSEYNLEPTKTKIFQIWIEPSIRGGAPTWGAKPFPKSDRSGKLITIASGLDGDKDALPIRAQARVLATTLKAGESAEYTPSPARFSLQRFQLPFQKRRWHLRKSQKKLLSVAAPVVPFNAPAAGSTRRTEPIQISSTARSLPRAHR